MRAGTAMAQFWMATERLHDGTEIMDGVLETRGGDDLIRGQASFAGGMLHFWVGNDERAKELCGRALAIARAADDLDQTARALTGLARVALRTEDYPESRRLATEALSITDGTENWAGLYNALHILGVTAQMSGELPEAQAYMTRTIALAESLGNRKTVGSESGNLSMVERQLGNLDRAEELGKLSLEIAVEFEDNWWIPYCLNGLAAVALDRRQLQRAARLIGAAEAMVESQGAAWPPDEVVHYRATLGALEEQMSTTDFDRSRSEGRSLSVEDAVALGLSSAQE